MRRTAVIACCALIAATALVGNPAGASDEPRVTAAAATPLLGPMAAPSGTASAFAIIGAIALPGTVTDAVLYTSPDDTVYMPARTGAANYVAIVYPGTTSGDVDDSLSVPSAYSVAVSRDDTVYVASYVSPGKVWVFASGASTPDDTITTAAYPHDVAVNADDTLVVSSRNGGTALIQVFAPDDTVTSAVNVVSGNPGGIAINSQGDFAFGSDGTSAYLMDADSLTIDDTLTGMSVPSSLGYNRDDTLYIISRGANLVNVFNVGSTTPDATVALGVMPVQLAVAANGDVFTANVDANSVSRIPSGSLIAETAISGINRAHGITTTSNGLVYVSSSTSRAIFTVAEASSSLSPATASAGTSVTVGVDGLPAGVVMDDTTVTSVWWGDDTVPFTRTAGLNEVSVIVPAGSGSVPLVVEVNGGNAISAGTFSYPSTPPTPPVFPPSAPLGVSGVAGDGSVSVTWSAPASSGSFAVSTYQVTSSPSGGSCLVSTTSCEIDGLVNDTAYTFTVRALNAAGWGAQSDPSDPVTPRAEATIVITGTRSGTQVRVDGVTTGLIGQQVTPHVRFPGQASYQTGTGVRTVNDDGSFEWQRRTGKKIYVYFAADNVRSLRVIIPAR